MKLISLLISLALLPLTNNEENETTSSSKRTVYIEKQILSKNNVEKLYNFHIAYPKVQIAEQSLFHRINLDFQIIWTEALGDFRRKSVRAQGKSREVKQSYLNFDYTTYQINDNLLSIKFEQEVFYGGKDEPSYLTLTYNFDIKNSKRLELSNIFDVTKPYESEITALVKSRVGNCRLNNKKLFENFTLQEDYFVLNFDDLSTKDSNCTKEVKISWSEIQHLLTDYQKESLNN